MEDPGPALLSPSEFWQILFILLGLILLSGFFSLFDLALSASRKARLQKEAEGGSKKYLRALKAAENPRPYLSAAHVWIILLRILMGVLAGYSIALFLLNPAYYGIRSFTTPLIVCLALALLFLAALFLGDLIPRIIARSAPEKVCAAALPLFNILALPIWPFNFLSLAFSNMIRRVFRVEIPNPGMTEDELRLALAEGEKSGIVESNERTMVEGVFYLGDRHVGAFMTHRSEIQWLDVNAKSEDILAKALEYRSQRCFPVADGTLDEIVGAAYLEDIVLDRLTGSQKGLRSVMKKAQFIPETMSALKAFESFKKGEANFLFVMDEYGGFAGIISVRDLMEEIVGELSSPIQEEDPLIQREDGSWLADGGLNIDEAAERLSLPGLGADHPDYHTLAGFVLSLAEELPRTGQSFTYQDYRFTVVDMDGNRIDKLLIEKEEKKGEE